MYIHTTCTDVPCRKQTQIEFYRISDIQKASEPDNFGFYMIEILTFDRLIWHLRSGDFLFPFCFYLHEGILNLCEHNTEIAFSNGTIHLRRQHVCHST